MFALRRTLRASALALGFAAVSALPSASAQVVGNPLPPAELEGFAQTGAKSFGDYSGRLVLLEFFAYW